MRVRKTTYDDIVKRINEENLKGDNTMNITQNPYSGERILAKNITVSNDSRATGLNNNDLIIGPSGAGKTRGYVKPNILQCNGSMIIADTKGDLIGEMGEVLRRNGYRVLHINFKDLGQSCGYNPLDYIRKDARSGKYNEQDILTIAQTVVPNQDLTEPFWDNAAKMYLACAIAYVMECLPEKEHNLKSVTDLCAELSTGGFYRLLDERAVSHPESYSVRLYKLFQGNLTADRMEASIVGILNERLNEFTIDGAVRMFTSQSRISFKSLGREKTAVFLTISDTDRSMDRLVSLFYTQALHALCDSADKDYPDHRLPIPVRLILDDFATNAYIPDFDKIISVIRSREIYVSVILQSITQLSGLYGYAGAQTIINNCDNCLYLGGQDMDTAKLMSVRANKPLNRILDMPLDSALLFTRGQAARQVERFDLKEHEKYRELPEYIKDKASRNEISIDDCIDDLTPDDPAFFDPAFFAGEAS